MRQFLLKEYNFPLYFTNIVFYDKTLFMPLFDYSIMNNLGHKIHVLCIAIGSYVKVCQNKQFLEGKILFLASNKKLPEKNIFTL